MPITEIRPDSIVRVFGGKEFKGENKCKTSPSLKNLFKRWRKQQALTSFVVMCRKGNAHLVKDSIKSHGAITIAWKNFNFL
jgi:hypothetical protein